MNMMHKPLHPGEIVKEALCEGTKLNITEIANRLQVSRSTLSRLLNSHTGISVDMAYRLAMFLNTSPEMWLNIQKDYDLWEAKKRMAKVKIKPFKNKRRSSKSAKQKSRRLHKAA